MSTGQTVVETIKRLGTNCFYYTVGCCVQTKEDVLIQTIEIKIRSRKQKFGIEYMDLVLAEGGDNTEAMNTLVQQAKEDIQKLLDEIAQHNAAKEQHQKETQEKLAGGTKPSTPAPTGGAGSTPTSTTPATTVTATSTTSAPAPAKVEEKKEEAKVEEKVGETAETTPATTPTPATTTPTATVTSPTAEEIEVTKE